MQHYDASILGGALTGGVLFAAAAPIFVKHKKTLAIIERNVQPPPDNRMLSLGHYGGTYLKQIGLWDELEPHICPVTSLNLAYVDPATAVGKKYSQTIEAKDVGLPVLGWTLPHALLHNILWDRIEKLSAEHDGLDWYKPYGIDKIIPKFDEQRPDRVLLKSENSVTADDISTQLILKATGVNPNQLSSGEYQQFDTMESCPVFAVAQIKLNNPQQGRGYWFYAKIESIGYLSLALTPSTAKDVWTAILSLPPLSEIQNNGGAKPQAESMSKQIGKANRLTTNDYVDILNSIIPGGCSLIGDKVSSYPAISYIARERLKGQQILIGNAAHSIAPLGGQNFNLTLWTIDQLCTCLPNYLDNQFSTSPREHLAEFIINTEEKLQQRINLVHNLDRLLRQGKLANYLPAEIPQVLAKNLLYLAIGFFAKL